MSLSLEIQRVRDESLQALDHCLRYVRDTNEAWRILQRLSKQESAVETDDPDNQQQRPLAELVSRVEHYTTIYLTESALERTVSIFEDFLFGLLRIWLLEHPRSLEKKLLEFSTVLDAVDLVGVKTAVIDRELMELKYQRIEEWFRFLEKRINVELMTGDDIAVFVELKARRDVITHSQGIVTNVYLQKAGAGTDYILGERVQVTEAYLQNGLLALKSLIETIANAVLQKVPH